MMMCASCFACRRHSLDDNTITAEDAFHCLQSLYTHVAHKPIRFNNSMTFRSSSPRRRFSPEVIVVSSPEDGARLDYYDQSRGSSLRRDHYVDSGSSTSVANFVARVRNDIHTEKVRVRSKIQDIRYNRLVLDRSHYDIHKTVFDQHDEMLARLRTLEDELEFNVNECIRLQTELDRIHRKEEWNNLQSGSRRSTSKNRSASRRSRSNRGTRRLPISV